MAKRLWLRGLAGTDTPDVVPDDNDVVTFDAAANRWYPAPPQLPPGAIARSLMQPHGTLVRKYEFTSGTQSWTASAGVLSHDASNGYLLHDIGATGASEILLEPAAPTGGNIADGEVWFDYMSETNGATALDTGIIFRATDANNFMGAFIRMNGANISLVELFKRVAGTFTSLGSTNLNAWNFPRFPVTGPLRARVFCRFVGEHIEIGINEVFTASFNDSSFTTGIVGIRHIARNANTQVAAYDNVTVYSLPSTWTYPVYD